LITLIFISNGFLLLYFYGPLNWTQMAANDSSPNQRSRLRSFFTSLKNNVGAGDFSESEAEEVKASLKSINPHPTAQNNLTLRNESGYYLDGLGDLGQFFSEEAMYGTETHVREENEDKATTNRFIPMRKVTKNRTTRGRGKVTEPSRRQKREAQDTGLRQRLARTNFSVLERRTALVPKPCTSEMKNKDRSRACYQCSSVFGNKTGEKCDNVLWGITRKSEKYEFQ
jgi:hypothetical protein